MLIIPVIDIRGGVAVRAVAGERAHYRPIKSPLADSPDPVAVARGYQSVFPFPTLYLADLDGIEGRGTNRHIHSRVADAWEGGDVWLDDGSIEAEPSHQRVRPVIGSETLLAAGACQSVLGGKPLNRTGILSLDFHGLTFMGPPELLAYPSVWPGAIIVMTLASVGRGEGPDLKRVAAIAEMAGTQAPRVCGRRCSQYRRRAGAERFGRIGRSHRERVACRQNKNRRSGTDRRLKFFQSTHCEWFGEPTRRVSRSNGQRVFFPIAAADPLSSAEHYWSFPAVDGFRFKTWQRTDGLPSCAERWLRLRSACRQRRGRSLPW